MFHYRKYRVIQSEAARDRRTMKIGFGNFGKYAFSSVRIFRIFFFAAIQ